MGSKKGFVEPENYLTEVLPDGTLSIVRYRGSKANINVPSEIDGKRVTKIGDSSFYDCKSLISIELPDSIISIGEFAFYNCTRLTSIDLPDSITSIGVYTFAGCESLTSIVIPDGLTSIGDDAMWDAD